MNNSSNPIEKIKSGIIVVLFISTILLLYFFWYQTPYDKYKMVEVLPKDKQIDILSIIMPSEIVISFGGENYSVLPIDKSKLWYNNSAKVDCMIDQFAKFSGSENIYMQEITKEQYDEVLKYRYIKAKFTFSMPFFEFCELYKIKKPISYNNIDSMTALTYSEGSKKSIFVTDEINKKYYRLGADEDVTNFTSVIKKIEEQQHDLFYPLGTFLGIENDTLIPVELKVSAVQFPYTQEIYIGDTDKISKIAKKFFGENFDFIRKITEENGKTIYMYGFGQKVFIANTDGSLEYKEEFIPENYTNTKFFKALKIAANFVNANGGFDSLEGASMKPYLKDVVPISGEHKGYKFIFGEIINKSKLFCKEGELLEVSVIGEQVIACKRNLIDFDEDQMLKDRENKSEETLSAVNMIAQNYEYIYEAMVKTAEGPLEIEEVNMTPSFEQIAKHIKRVDTGFLKNEGDTAQGLTVQPVWVVKAGNAVIYIDLYDFKPVYFTKAVQ